MARRPIDRWAVKLRYRPDLAVAFRALVRQSAIIVSAINRTFSGARDRLVPLLQKFGGNRKGLYWVLRGLRGGLIIDNVDGRMPGKILLKVGPRAGQDPATPIETADRSSERKTPKRERC